MLLACGTCGLSILSIHLPFYDEWMALTLASFVFYNLGYWIGEARPVHWLVQALVLFFGLLLGLIMFSAFLIPLAFLWTFLMLGRRANSSLPKVRTSALILLGLFAVSALWRTQQRLKLDEPTYLLGRLLAGGPGYEVVGRLSKQEPFPMEVYLKALENPREATYQNALRVLELRKLRPDERDLLKRSCSSLPSSARRQAVTAVAERVDKPEVDPR